MATAVKFRPKLGKKLTRRHFSDWERNLLSLTHELSGPLLAARLNLDQYTHQRKTASLKSLEANLRLMEDYLKTARLQIRQKSVPTRPFSVNKQLDHIISNLLPLATDRSVALSLINSNDCRVDGNATRFKQIISCFIRNGIEAYDGTDFVKRPVTIRHYHDGDYLVIAVEDMGSGIALHDQPKIFEPYYSTKSDHDSGLGLGLSLAAESITEDFNGRIELESNKGHGTAFRLYFLPFSP